MGFKSIFSAIFLFGTLFLLANADLAEDKQALLDFRRNISHSRPINWNENVSACNGWIGVTCNHDQSRIIAVRLPGVGFHGLIPPNTLSRLSFLQILSLRSNSLSGPFPSDFSRLGNLTTLHLEFNHFSGPLPLDYSVWKNLSIVNLSNNSFNGTIPSSILNLTHLTALTLANNSLSGDVPDLNIPSLQYLDLSNNNLSGNVPQSLQRFPNWAFVGNNLSTQNAPPPLPPVLPPNAQPSKKSRSLSESAILGFIVGSCAIGFVVFAVSIILCCAKKEDKNGLSAKSQSKEGTKMKVALGSEDGNNRLAFFEGCNYAFDLEDLLRASAEVLGKGTFGTTYKAALEDSTTLVVKRLKEASVPKRDFEHQMEIVGNIKHENVAALRAYFYSKDEKLMVYDYCSQGSASTMLHAQKGEGRVPLDWETRLRIAIGAAKGIAHIHTQNGEKLVHGNIKASNIFLNSQGYGCVCDLGLATLMTSIIPPVVTRIPGYRAPEVTDTRKPSQMSDVYSFGVFLLELLTGKSPVNATGGEIVHLVRWVHSVVREEWTAEVFDVELLRYPNIEEEMVEMLRIGMTCASKMPEQRPKILDVVKMVEDIRSRQSSATRSEVSTPALTPPTHEIGSFSVS